MFRRLVKPGLWAAASLCALSTPAAMAADTNYSYDALGRLRYTAYTSGMGVSYVYDDLGNRLSVVSSTGTTPVAMTDAVRGMQNTALALYPLRNDYDQNGGTLSITAVGSPSHGTTSRSGNTVTYTPTTGYYSPAGTPDSFTYTLSDGTTTTTGTVNVTVRRTASIPYAVVPTAGTSNNLRMCWGTGSEVIDEDASGFIHGQDWNNDNVYAQYVVCWLSNPNPYYEWEYNGEIHGGYAYWPADWGPWSQQGEPLKYDLGAVYDLDRVEAVVWASLYANATVEISSNGTTWTSAGTVPSRASADAAHIATTPSVMNFSPGTSARYVRLKVPPTPATSANQIFAPQMAIYLWTP